jgi:hypothetical protein
MKKILFILSISLAIPAVWVLIELGMSTFPFWYWHPWSGMESLAIFFFSLPLIIISLVIRIISIELENIKEFIICYFDLFLWFFYYLIMFIMVILSQFQSNLILQKIFKSNLYNHFYLYFLSIFYPFLILLITFIILVYYLKLIKKRSIQTNS